MRLHRLQLLNFRQHADTTIDFGPGITGIIGPNGAGKTTILEAIGWALYGKPAARGKRETIRFVRAPERAPVRVELDFELAGHRYRVVRELTRAEVFLDGDDSAIATSTNGVTELLQRRLGMSRSEFFNTYFTGQKQLSIMAAMGPVERAQFLSRVLGYEKLRSAQELVRTQRKLIVAELSGIRGSMPEVSQVADALAAAERRVAETRRLADERQREHADCAGRIATVAPRWDEAQRQRQAWQSTVAELQTTDARIAGLTAEGERVGSDLSAIVLAGVELEGLRLRTAGLPQLATELRLLDELYRGEGRRDTLREALVELETELVRLQQRRDQLLAAPQEEQETTVALAAKRAELEEAQAKLEERRTVWVRATQEAQTKRTALLQQHADLKLQLERIQALGADGVCPTCSRVLGESFDRVRGHIEEQIEAVTVDGKYFRNRVEDLEEIPEEVKQLEEQRRTITQEAAGLERTLARIQSAVQELATGTREVTIKEQRRAQLLQEIALIPGGFDGERHAAVRAEIDSLAPMVTRAERLAALFERGPQIQQDYERISVALLADRGRAQELRTALDGLQFSETAFAAVREEFETASEAAHRAAIARVEAESELRSAREALESAGRASEEFRRMEERATALARDRRLHEELDRSFSDLRTDLNAQLRPELSELASTFLSELTDGRYGELELTDSYDVLVLEEGIPKPVISGGEEDLANLVLRLAISQMIAERAGQAFSLLVLDEVFGSLDELRRHNVVDLLRSLHDRFEQVVLITHIESVRDGLDRVLSVRYDEATGSSRVEECEPADVVGMAGAGEPAMEVAAS
ncbi:MAG TPA: SMC family ATPase [Gemmatimonadaceae bacterium]|nr:SMC family ATPase [Gemmatimonadaceae bacterium]